MASSDQDVRQGPLGAKGYSREETRITRRPGGFLTDAGRPRDAATPVRFNPGFELPMMRNGKKKAWFGPQGHQ